MVFLQRIAKVNNYSKTFDGEHFSELIYPVISRKKKLFQIINLLIFDFENDCN